MTSTTQGQVLLYLTDMIMYPQVTHDQPYEMQHYGIPYVYFEKARPSCVNWYVTSNGQLPLSQEF